jgi:hypothetical protein
MEYYQLFATKIQVKIKLQGNESSDFYENYHQDSLRNVSGMVGTDTDNRNRRNSYLRSH